MPLLCILYTKGLILYFILSLALHNFVHHHFQLVYYLERVNFTTVAGHQVSFDGNSEAEPIMDIMNWAWLPEGSTLQIQSVGVFKRSASAGGELILDEDRIYWNFESKKVTSAF